MEQLNPFLGYLIYGSITFGIGYVLGKLGLSKIETDIAQIKDDISNFHFQAPFTVTPTIINPPSATSPVLSGTTGKAIDSTAVVAHI
jgi:hypothetical protein